MTQYVPKLLADIDCGEGNIKFNEAWANSSALLRADLLQDWIEILQHEYNRALKDFESERRPT